jgi:hypothetical protein
MFHRQFVLVLHIQNYENYFNKQLLSTFFTQKIYFYFCPPTPHFGRFSGQKEMIFIRIIGVIGSIKVCRCNLQNSYNTYNTHITYNSYLTSPLKMKKATGVNLRLFLTRQPEGLDFIHNPHSQFNI